jgi:hypothetical protein
MGGNETAYDSRMMSDRFTDMDVSQDGLSPVSLVIPCRSEYVALCRLVAGALGARDSLDEDVVADLKVIVTEACNCFLAMASDGPARAWAGDPAGAASSAAHPQAAEPGVARGCSIRLDFDSRPDEFVISLLYPEKRELVSWLQDCEPVSEAGLGLTILRALTDEMVELDTDADGTILRLTKRLPA